MNDQPSLRYLSCNLDVVFVVVPGILMCCSGNIDFIYHMFLIYHFVYIVILC